MKDVAQDVAEDVAQDVAQDVAGGRFGRRVGREREGADLPSGRAYAQHTRAAPPRLSLGDTRRIST